MTTNFRTMGYEYSIDSLYQDIVKQYDKEEDSGDTLQRDRRYYLKVLNYFVDMAQKIKGQKGYKAGTVIDNELSNDASLFAYTFFLSSNTQFDYSWNYLRKQWHEYAKVLESITAFILDMIDKINVLYSNIDKIQVYSFVFADLFVLTFQEESHRPQVTVLLNSIGNLFRLDNSYLLSAKLNDVTILATNCGVGKHQETNTFLEYLLNENTDATEK